MALYEFSGVTVRDAQGIPAAGATGTLYDKDDASFSTPLTVTDLSGLPLALKSDQFGQLPDFQIADKLRAVWKPSDPSMPTTTLLSMDGVVKAADDAAAAALAAEVSRIAAEEAQAAAQSLALPPGGTTDQVLAKRSNADGDYKWKDDTGGTGGGTVPTDVYSKAETDSRIATANASQSTVDRNRANHTGTQTISTIVNLRAELDALAAGGGSGGAVSSVNSKTGAVVLTKTDIGLGLVQNVAPADLPVSNLAQQALDQKAAATHTHTTSQVTGLDSALDTKISGVKVFTGTEARPSAAIVQWVAQPGYSGGAPVNMSAGDLWAAEGV